MNLDPDFMAVRTLDEVAQSLGLSRNVVWKIERRAMHKIRKRLLQSFDIVNGRLVDKCQQSEKQSESVKP
jgi:transcriptional regulator